MITTDSKYSVDGNDYYVANIGNTAPKLDPGIYRININPMKGPYLTLTQDKFTFPYKVYGINDGFVERVIKTWECTNKNLGILFNGTRGTGKTVTAEIIANTVNLPIILVDFHYPGLQAFLSTITQDVVVFFDEFEKVYKDNNGRDQSNEVLSLFDGASSMQNRRLFLLTSNNTWIDENFKQRPGRIRYLKTFANLQASDVEEIVDDLLNDKELKSEVIGFISKLELITIDIVKSIVEEVNIHGDSPNEFGKFFNVKAISTKFNIVDITDPDNHKPIAKDVLINGIDKWGFTDAHSGTNLLVGNKLLGHIEEVIDSTVVIVRTCDQAIKTVKSKSLSGIAYIDGKFFTMKLSIESIDKVNSSFKKTLVV